MNLKKNITLLLLITISSLPFSSFAQSATSPNLNDQFKTIIEGSNNFQEYKVIKQTQINTLWKNTLDSLNQKQQNIFQSQQEIKNLKATIAKLQKSVTAKENELQKAQNSVDEISFLGLFQMSKANYKILMWSLIILLTLSTLFLFYRIKFFGKEARYRRQLYDEVTEEYKAYKIKANDNEKKLARALQDERNKLDGTFPR